MPTVIGPGGNFNKNYETFKNAKKFLENNYGRGIPAAYYRTSLNERNKNLNYSIKNNNGKTAGFAFLKNFNKERYLYLIGAKKGMGGILLKRIINNTRKAGLKTIALEPVEDAIYFYLKHGFIHNNKNKMILNLTKNHTNTIKRHEAATKLQRIYRARNSVKEKAYERYYKAMREERERRRRRNSNSN